MKNILISLFFFINPLIIQQAIDIGVLKKDPVLIQYKKVQTELMEGIKSKRYKLPKDQSYQKEFVANPSKENMIKVLKKYGTTNTEEYVDKLFLQTTLMFEFLKKHPEITKLDQTKKLEVISKLLLTKD